MPSQHCYTAQDHLPREQNCLLWARPSSINDQLRQPTTDMLTGQSDLGNSQLRHSSNVTVGCVQWTVKANCDTATKDIACAGHLLDVLTSTCCIIFFSHRSSHWGQALFVL